MCSSTESQKSSSAPIRTVLSKNLIAVAVLVIVSCLSSIRSVHDSMRHDAATLSRNAAVRSDVLASAADRFLRDMGIVDSDNSTNVSPFAYAFIVSGCTETSCLGYVLNAVVASRILKETHSTADIVMMVRMHGSSNATKLSDDNESWLKQAGVQLQYLDKVGSEYGFGGATLEKFRVLEMSEYDRVLFLDADMVPVCNLDYWFDLSMQGNLSENVVIQGGVAPATASTFMVTPKAGEFSKIVDIVRRHRARDVNATVFDKVLGWGHVIDPEDRWVAWNKMGHYWDFYAVGGDQGLLWHWLKYERMNFTLIHQTGIETWGEVTHNPDYNSSMTGVFEVGNQTIAMVDFTKEKLQGCGGKRYGRGGYARTAPYSDSFHYSGWQKPWNQPLRAWEIPRNTSEISTGRDFWLYWLGEANSTWKLELEDEITMKKGNPLGDKPSLNDLLHPDTLLPTE